MTGLEDFGATIVDNLQNRTSGPLGFRFIMQPTIAVLLAVRDGIGDGRSGARPYMLEILFPSEGRWSALKEGLKATNRVIILAFVLDMVYQIFVLKTFHPGAAFVIALFLAFIPYTLARGPVGRLATTYFASKSDGT